MTTPSTSMSCIWRRQRCASGQCGCPPRYETEGVVQEIVLQMFSYHGDVVSDVIVELTDPDVQKFWVGA